MIVVLGSIIAKPETFAQLRQLAIAHVERSRREPGCIAHAVAVDCHNALKLTFTEKWADRAALMAHFKVPASIELVVTARKLAAEPPTIEIYDTTKLEL
jgi:quinol monooxygenase YgiN